MLIEAILSAGVLVVILAMSISHLPTWLKRIIRKIPIWLQCTLLHFGYAGWIGGVSGHLMGAPLAILWFFSYVYWLKPQIDAELGQIAESRREIMTKAARKIKGWIGQAQEIGADAQVALATA